MKTMDIICDKMFLVTAPLVLRDCCHIWNVGWGGGGLGWRVGCDNVLSTCTQTHAHTHTGSSLALAHTHIHWMLRHRIFSCTCPHWMLRHRIFSCTCTHRMLPRRGVGSSLALAHTLDAAHTGCYVVGSGASHENRIKDDSHIAP